jgi:hypothetical protein
MVSPSELHGEDFAIARQRAAKAACTRTCDMNELNEAAAV